MLAFAVAFLAFSVHAYLDEGEIPQTSETTPEVAAGSLVWRKHNCMACHQIYGLGGYLGPDLTNVLERRPAAYVRAVLSNGIREMPDFQLSEQEIEQLVAFLRYIDTTGTFPARDWPLPWYSFGKDPAP